MSKKKITRNNNLNAQNKINVLNKRINKQRKKIINELKENIASGLIELGREDCQKLEKLESERNKLQQRIIIKK
tara:strand:+ start:201 stop:422 length:222 start_codon:yes stop_codon:yes gene_type:complete